MMKFEDWKKFASALALLVMGCGSSSSPSPDAALDEVDARTSVPTPPLPYYEVPVDDPEQAPHAFFGVPDVHYVIAGGIVTLDYDFPEDLSGVIDQSVELSGPVDAQGNATISGPEGTGTCTVENGIVRCVEHFTALPMDPEHARSLVSSYSADPAARAARTAVIDRFVSDPIGIVVFDLAAASEPSGGDND
jgi:hypothetical protein